MTKVSAIVNIVRAGALSALMAGSVATYSTNPVKTHKSENPPQTEVVSKEGAEAVKAMNFQQQKPTVPTVHNKKLDETLKKFFDKEEDLKNIDETLNNLYKNCGTYMASAVIQQQIDYNMFLAFLRGDVELLKKINDYRYNKVKPEYLDIGKEKANKIMEWLEPNFQLVMDPVFHSFDHPPDAKELSESIDKYVYENTNKLFNKTFFESDYVRGNKEFRAKQDKISGNIVQKNSDYIAHQINRADILLFIRLLESVGIDIGRMDDYNSGYRSNFLAFTAAVKPTVD